MYTSLKNVQVLVSLLKQYGIRHLVLSPGTRDVPLVHTVETDPFFQCYSMVDERSAAFFALGIAESTGEPVGFTCTSSTAACNYLSAVKEASERNIPLLALTADRDYRHLYQMEDQMISQINMYAPYTSAAVNLPTVKDREDIWYCTRKVNEALIGLSESMRPVQINYEVTRTDLFYDGEVPTYRKINYHHIDQITDYTAVASKLKNKRILVLCGQLYEKDDRLKKALELFSEQFNAVVAADLFSNMDSDRLLQTVKVTESIDADEFENYLPDIVITLGGHNWSFIKYALRRNSSKISHWHISFVKAVTDGFMALRELFIGGAEKFFSGIVQTNQEKCFDHSYYELWKARIERLQYPEMSFSNFSVIRDLAKRIPQDSLVHLSILNSTRMLNFVELPVNVKAFSNLGADGIDGTLSTFLAQASQYEKMCFLIIGDLSFLYDINASDMINKNNIRILLINNFAGGEFHNNFGVQKISTLNCHIAAGHQTRIAEFSKLFHADFLTASNQEELDKALDTFVKENDKPIILEVYTNAEKDAAVLKQFYAFNRIADKHIYWKKAMKKIKAKFKR